MGGAALQPSALEEETYPGKHTLSNSASRKRSSTFLIAWFLRWRLRAKHCFADLDKLIVGASGSSSKSFPEGTCSAITEANNRSARQAGSAKQGLAQNRGGCHQKKYQKLIKNLIFLCVTLFSRPIQGQNHGYTSKIYDT